MSSFWCVNGQLHREDGPAFVSSDGGQQWYLNGRRHRENGPAVVYADGGQEWWLNGVIIPEMKPLSGD